MDLATAGPSARDGHARRAAFDHGLYQILTGQKASHYHWPIGASQLSPRAAPRNPPKRLVSAGGSGGGAAGGVASDAAATDVSRLSDSDEEKDEDEVEEMPATAAEAERMRKQEGLQRGGPGGGAGKFAGHAASRGGKSFRIGKRSRDDATGAQRPPAAASPSGASGAVHTASYVLEGGGARSQTSDASRPVELVTGGPGW